MDLDIGAAFLLHDLHIFAVEIIPFHGNAVSEALAGSNGQLVDDTSSAVRITGALEGSELWLWPRLVFATGQLLDVGDGIAVNPFQIDGMAHQDGQDRGAFVRLGPGVL
ncbi:hypothetical protein [Celeribacter neptunius]|uniref:hypothetical protein n=1 Tax=Celeribacter neptunius TaxID=588602 RepID=UPI001FE3EC2C|nr:hypothetical protein [Celeribacter neptunius]